MSPDLAARVARIWAFRARFEREAEARFAQLAEQLAAIGIPAELVALARRAAEEEARHAVLAGELAARFGQPVEAPRVQAVPDIVPGGLTERQAVLYRAVALCAVMESLSAALLRAMRAAAEDAQVREVLHAILTDEVHHSRIGWGTLAFEAGRTDVRWLGPYVPAMLAGTVHDEIFGAPEGEAGAVLEPWGGLRRERRRALFVEAVQGLVLPGLAHFGVPTEPGATWMADKLQA